MSYSKISPESFISKLAAGDYKNAGAARRAVGRSSLSDAGKKLCYTAIADHFKDTETPAPPARQARKKVAKKVVKKVGKKKAARAPKTNAKGKAPKSEKPMFNSTEEQLAKIHLAGQRVGTIVQAIRAMKEAKEVSPELDTDAGAQQAQSALTSIMAEVHDDVVVTKSDPGVAKAFAETAGAAVGIPGATPEE